MLRDEENGRGSPELHLTILKAWDASLGSDLRRSLALLSTSNEKSPAQIKSKNNRGNFQATRVIGENKVGLNTSNVCRSERVKRVPRLWLMCRSEFLIADSAQEAMRP